MFRFGPLRTSTGSAIADLSCGGPFDWRQALAYHSAVRKRPQPSEPRLGRAGKVGQRHRVAPLAVDDHAAAGEPMPAVEPLADRVAIDEVAVLDLDHRGVARPAGRQDAQVGPADRERKSTRRKSSHKSAARKQSSGGKKK